MKIKHDRNENKIAVMKGMKYIYYLILTVFVVSLCILSQVEKKAYFLLPFCLLFLIAIIYISNNQNYKTENVFLFIFTLSGLLFMLALPPFRMLDEARHFVRAYDVAEGGIFSKGFIPEYINVELSGDKATWERWKNLENKEILGNGAETQVEITNYSGFSYPTASLSIFIAKHFTQNIIMLVYSARLGQFLTCVFLLYLAVKYIPTGKNLVMLIALLPMTIQEMATLSGDAFVIALTIDTVAFVLYQRSKTEGAMKPIEIASLFLMAFFLGQCKYIYVFVCALFIFIPQSRFGGIKKKSICAVCLIAFTGATICGTLFFTGALDAYILKEDADMLQAAIASAADSQQSPFHGYSIWQVMFRTFRFHYRLYLATSTGFGFGSVDILPDIRISYILLMLLFYVGVLEEKKEQDMPLPFRIGAVCVSVISVIALFYVYQYNVTEAGSVDVLQGRYFIPLFLPVMLGISLNLKRMAFPIIKREYFLPGIAALDLYIVMFIFGACIV